MKRWLLHQDGIIQRHNLKGNPRARGYEVVGRARTGALLWQKEKAEVYQGETETAPSDPTDWEGEVEYEPYA